jgi:hypothetical protein
MQRERRDLLNGLDTLFYRLERERFKSFSRAGGAAGVNRRHHEAVESVCVETKANAG